MQRTGTHAPVSKLITKGLTSGLFYGADVLLARSKQVLYRKEFGTFDGTRPLVPNAVFDVASLTKPVVTASLIQALGFPLDQKASHFLPAFSGDGKTDITLRQLAAHSAGLPATVRLSETCKTQETAYNALLNVPLLHPPDHKVIYSCLGYLVLGKVLEAATGQSLSYLFHTHLAGPLGMLESCFLPLQNGINPKQLVRSGAAGHPAADLGVVHDGNARLFGGIAGNAGLFTTVSDLHIYAANLIGPAPPFPTAPMFTNQSATGGIPRSLGWEVQTPAHPASCGPAFFEGAIGHTGFTGTSLWMDRKTETIAIILSNRTAISHSSNLEAMRQFRRDIHQCLFESVAGESRI